MRVRAAAPVRAAPDAGRPPQGCRLRRAGWHELTDIVKLKIGGRCHAQVGPDRMRDAGSVAGGLAGSGTTANVAAADATAGLAPAAFAAAARSDLAGDVRQAPRHWRRHHQSDAHHRPRAEIRQGVGGHGFCDPLRHDGAATVDRARDLPHRRDRRIGLRDQPAHAADAHVRLQRRADRRGLRLAGLQAVRREAARAARLCRADGARRRRGRRDL